MNECQHEWEKPRNCPIECANCGMLLDNYLKGISAKDAELQAQCAAQARALQFANIRLSSAYEKMNWFASGESMKEHRRIEASDILIEVYQVLAPVPREIDKALSTTAGAEYAKYVKDLEVGRDR